MLLSDVLIQQGRQVEGLLLKQGVGLGHEQGEPSNQLPLHQGQAGQLGVVDEALPAEDGVVNAAAWKNTGSGGLPTNAFHILSLGIALHHPSPPLIWLPLVCTPSHSHCVWDGPPHPFPNSSPENP